MAERGESEAEVMSVQDHIRERESTKQGEDKKEGKEETDGKKRKADNSR